MELLVAGPQAAVVTLPGAMIGDLDEPAEMDLVPDVAPPDPVGPLPEERQFLFPFFTEPRRNLLSIRRPLI